MPGIALYAALIALLRWPKPRGFTKTNALIFLAPFILGGIAAGTRAGSLIGKYLGGHPTGTLIADPIKAGVYMLASLAYRMEIGLWCLLWRRLGFLQYLG